MKDMIVNLILRGQNSQMNAALARSESRIRNFGGVARREFDRTSRSAGTLQSKLAALGISFSATLIIKQSAQLDQSLTRIGQTADMSHVQVTGLRKEFFRMAKETGQSVEALRDGFNVAVQSGLKFNEALPVTEAVSRAMAVTGRSAEELTNALTVASQVFHFDLTNPKTAVELLDKMTVAGREGKAELESLSNIYARVAISAKRSGMNNDQTLAFIETLSLVESLPERLSTLSDSTLRLFNNPQYLLKAQAATGVKFFNDKGMRRNPLSVLTDIMKKYQTLKTDEQRMMFKRRAFQGADLDTQKGLELLFDEEINALEKTQKITQKIETSGGQIKKDLADAINNAEAQANRLKNTLRESADQFSIILNRGLSAAIKKMLDAKKDGGMELSGKQIAGGAAAAAGVAYLGYRLGGPALKKLLGRMGRTGAGIAEGKAIEYATGVTPVFVVNMPGGGIMPGPGGVPTGTTVPGGGKGLGFWKIAGLLGLGGAAVVGTSEASRLWLEHGGPNAYMQGRQVLSGMGPIGGILGGIYSATALASGHFDQPEVKNDVNINIFADFDNRRVAVENSDPNTKAVVNLNRGSWNNILGVQ